MDDFLKSAYDMLYLTVCGLNGKVPEKSRIESLDLEKLFKACQFHSLTSIVGTALESCGVNNSSFSEAKAKAVRKNILLDAERGKILGFMEKNGIWYMPLKGVILKDLYPKLGMRQMSDNDILFDGNFRRELYDFMTENGYTAEIYGKGNHDEYLKSPVYNFELHTALFNSKERPLYAEYYADVKNRLVKDSGNSFGYHFTREDFYIYIIMHEYKHYTSGGTGLRSLADCYIYNKKYGDILDREYISAELKKLEAAEFEEKSRILCEKVFGSPVLPELSGDELKMLEYHLTSGAYGTTDRYYDNKIERFQNENSTASKSKYLMRRIFPDMAFYKTYYPTCFKFKVLIPFAWFFRLVRGVTVRNKKLRTELEAVAKSELK